jgi:NitT/TauT family transport system substrate-binding protein
MARTILRRVVTLSVAASVGLGAAAAQAQTKVVLRTDYKFNGYVAPMALALERGYYKQAGLDVSIEQGQGSGTTVQTVASGADTFGMADAATAILGITSQNIPVKILSVYTQTGTMGLIYHPDSAFKGDLKALKGKVVISSAGVADLRMLSPTLASAGMTTSDVQLQLVDQNARVPLFLKTPDSFLTGFATGDLLRVRSRLPDAKYVPYAQYGVIVYGTGLVAANSTIEKNPDLVRKFVMASQKGWDDALTDPDAAAAASVKLFPDLTKDFVLDGLNIALTEQLHTPATKGHPIGWTATSDWEKTLAVLTQYANLKAKPLETYVNNTFNGN